MIDEAATFEKFGYYSTDWKPQSNKRIVAVCDDCGKIREVNKRTYCSLCHSCAVKINGKKQIGKNNPHWKGGKIKRICVICGKSFYTPPSNIAYGPGRGRFCSKKCKDISHSEIMKSEKNPNRIPRLKQKCEVCGNVFFIMQGKKKQYCSHKCRGIAKRGENSPHWKGGEVKKICVYCGSSFYIAPSRVAVGWGKYCSNECRDLANQGENNPNWKGGRSIKYCSKWNDTFREYIRNKYDRKCFLCDKTEEENGKRLSVHHVNGNKKCGCDGDTTCQFIPLCANCHSKVHFSKKDYVGIITNKMKCELKGWYI